MVMENQSYASALRSEPIDPIRVDRLEFLRSEDEREKRVLNASITHPTLNKNNDDLKAHVKNFFVNTLQMQDRSIDSNFQAKKGHKDNNIIVSFSDKRFKLFLYQAKKRLRQNESQEYQDLFINDDLTPYNFKRLMELKNYRKSFGRNDDPFRSIYTRDGRVYVKLATDDPTTYGTPVKNSSFLQNLKNSRTSTGIVESPQSTSNVS